jgi:hypothetical protein
MKQILVAEFLRAQAAWRLAHAESDPVRAARCAAALLDAAAFAAALGDDDPDLALLALPGCFRAGEFDPGPDGVSVARWWQYRDREDPHTSPRDLICALAAAITAVHERWPAG